MEKYYCAICDIEIDPEELLEGGRCPYCQTEIPEAVEDIREDEHERAADEFRKGGSNY